MQASFRLGTISGIEIGVHYTWLIAFALITVSLALAFFPQVFPGLSPTMDWILGAAAAVLLFGSVLAHELSHSFVAQRKGLQVRSITLFIFGGVSSIEGEPRSAGDELLIAGAGPLSSVILGLIFGGLLVAFMGTNLAVTALLAYLALVNLLLAAFNLIPGFPLDGGRVFRAIVWAVTGNYLQATQIATALGQGIAYLFIFGGLLLVFTGAFISGIWIALIGWFLSNAAQASRRQVRLQHAFAGIKVEELMVPNPATISPDLTLRDMVDDYVMHRNIRAAPVVDDAGTVLGLVTVTDIKNVPREQWDRLTVGDIMTPSSQMVSVSPETNAGDALQMMGQRDVNQLPVMDSGRLVGLLSQSNVLRFLQVREELGMRP